MTSQDLSIAIGIDVGGTFTDLVAQTPMGDIVAKVPTVSGSQADGVLNGLQRLASTLDIDVQTLLSRTHIIVHGTTVGTNAMLEFSGATTWMLTNSGFRDIVDIRRNHREAVFDLRLQPPHPIVPRRRRIPIVGRIGAEGQEITALDEDAVVAAAGQMSRAGVESVVVCYLFSFLNPSHELRTREILQAELGDVHISLSHEVVPRIREYERFSTAAVDAYVTPTLARYLLSLEGRLRELGYTAPLSVMRSNGGLTDVGRASAHGVDLLFSGPAAGVVASARIGELTGCRELITLDMGGTSCDVSVIQQGQPRIGAETWMSRHRISSPVIDIATIGAGGGSIAWVDNGGALRIGPESAGSTPGPACYGGGGTRPTVTDANLVLGLLGERLGGAMRLDRDAAERAIADHVASPLRLSVIEAAQAIYTVVNQNMANAVRVVSLERGIDPREFSLMVFGGAGPLHAPVVARELSISRVIVPRQYAPVLCALGDVLSDLRETRIRSFYARSSQLSFDDLNNRLDAVVHEARSGLPALATDLPTVVERALEMRYKGQTHEVVVPVREAELPVSAESWRALRARFDDLHKEQYSFSHGDAEVEIINLRVDALARRGRDVDPRVVPPGGQPAPSGTRKVWLPDAQDQVEVPVVNGEQLAPGTRLRGPVLIVEPNTTVVVLEGHRVEVGEAPVYSIEEGS